MGVPGWLALGTDAGTQSRASEEIAAWAFPFLEKARSPTARFEHVRFFFHYRTIQVARWCGYCIVYEGGRGAVEMVGWAFATEMNE